MNILPKKLHVSSMEKENFTRSREKRIETATDGHRYARINAEVGKCSQKATCRKKTVSSRESGNTHCFSDPCIYAVLRSFIRVHCFSRCLCGNYSEANYTSPQCHITCPKNLVVSGVIRQGSYTDLLSLTRKIPSGETRTRFIYR